MHIIAQPFPPCTCLRQVLELLQSGEYITYRGEPTDPTVQQATNKVVGKTRLLHNLEPYKNIYYIGKPSRFFFFFSKFKGITSPQSLVNLLYRHCWDKTFPAPYPQ